MEYGCIGERLTHSFSKEIHKCFADYEYEIKEIPKDKLGDFMQKAEFRAINVTIPYKQAVMPYLYEISDTARRIGAVNTIVKRDGKLYGYNTDFFGMTTLIQRSGIEIQNKKVLILGSGGTSKTAHAVAESLEAEEIYVVSRKGGKGLITYEEMYESHTDAEIVINTTPVGMFPNPDAMPIDLTRFPKLNGVVDAIYNPLRSRLVLEAEALGAKATGGLYMLVAQAAYAVEKFIGTPMNPQKTDDVYTELLRQKQNMVLTGMPGSGKSTIGKKISELTRRPFFDTDELIVKKDGRSIPTIFKEIGEEGFRKIEAEVIEEIGSLGGYIIATGGGAVLSEENVKNLKANGRIFYIDRPLHWLTATSDRPLSSNPEDLKKRYQERYDVYQSTADRKISAVDDIKTNVEMILKSEEKC